jgi:hypothetical protein
MNKISIKTKKVAIPRHHITYHYRVNKPHIKPKLDPPRVKPVVKPKAAVAKKISRTTKVPFITSKSKMKPVRTRPMLTPRASARRASSRFDSQIPKIKSIRGVGNGKILAIFAPGPSILEAKIERLKGIAKIDLMTINKPDMRVWETDYWMFCDRTQYKRNKDYYHKYKYVVINTESIKAPHPRQIRIRNLPGKGFSQDMTKGFYIGRSTTFSSMQVAEWMGYDKIFIFGCDMARVVVEKNGKKKSLLHSYGINPDVPEKTRLKRFKKEAEFYDAASKIMSKELRNKFYFCSEFNPWPFVDKFNRLDHNKAVDYMLDCVKET